MTDPQTPTPTMLRPIIDQLRRQLAHLLTRAAFPTVKSQLLPLEKHSGTPASGEAGPREAAAAAAAGFWCGACGGGGAPGDAAGAGAGDGDAAGG